MKKQYWILSLLILAGLLLRLSHNLGISLWHDEAFSALMIRYPWKEMFYRLGLDVHPPMYYIALRLWHYVFGNSMWSLRGFSILFGVLTVPATYLFIKEAFHSAKMALWAALLVAISPFEMTFATEARMYTFGAFFAIMAAYYLVKVLRNGGWKNYAGFIITTAIIILTHYYLLFTAAGMGLYALGYLFAKYRWNLKKYWPIVFSYLVIFACFLPWLKTFLWQLKSVTQSYWIPDMTWWSIPSTLWSMLIGFADDTSKVGTQILLVMVTLFTIYFLYRFMRKTAQAEKWLVLLAIVMPFIGSVLFYLKSITCVHTGMGLQCSGRSLYQDRYFLYASVFYAMAFAMWLSQIKINWLSVALLILYLILNAAAISNYWSSLNLAHSPGMAGAAKYLGANVEPGQHVFSGTSFEFFNYKYYEETYYPTPTPPLLYTGGRSDISQISPVEGLPLLSNSDLAPTYSQYAHNSDTEWVIWTYAFGSNKPTVPANWTEVDEHQYPDVRPYIGTVIYVSEYRVN
jgi:4-amino-4-deoxy-L-arabinose transferase-like glycosyltransferase